MNTSIQKPRATKQDGSSVEGTSELGDEEESATDGGDAANEDKGKGDGRVEETTRDAEEAPKVGGERKAEHETSVEAKGCQQMEITLVPGEDDSHLTGWRCWQWRSRMSTCTTVMA